MQSQVAAWWDNFTMWVTLHIIIPVGALFLAHRVLKEEVEDGNP